MFLVHPTRLSKICAAGRMHPCGDTRPGRPRNSPGCRHPKKARTSNQKDEKFRKEPTRKAVFRSGGGPRGVLLPFLTRESISFYHTAGRTGKPARQPAARLSKSATPLEYQNHYRHASPFSNYFWMACIPLRKLGLPSGTGSPRFGGNRRAAASHTKIAERSYRTLVCSLFSMI